MRIAASSRARGRIPEGANPAYMCVLVTGFEPFGGQSANPSAQVALALHGRVLEGRKVIGAVLPCVFDVSVAKLKHLLRVHKPELVLCLGQAGGRWAISLERIAINVDDACLADNAGAAPIDEPVVAGGPAAYWATLPIKAVARALSQAGIPAEVSQTAGTFVCNHIFYALMHALRRGKARGGFIHVPFLPEQGSPSMILAEMIRGIEIAIAITLATQEDLRAGGGATH